MLRENKKIDFIGIGAPKSGSTWLAQCLSEHPEIVISPTRKELDFFNSSGHDIVKYNTSHYHKGLDWYFAQFPPLEKDKKYGEFSVSYLSDPEAYRRIYQAFPEIKILVILRNPVELVYSYYWYLKATVENKVPETFKEVVKSRFLFEYGMFYKYLQNFYKTFPQQNIHVVLFDEVKADSSKVLRQVYEFLQVDKDFVPPSVNTKVNQAMTVKSPFIQNLSHSFLNLLKKAKLENLVQALTYNAFLYDLYSKINIKRDKYPPIPEADYQQARNIFSLDIINLEKLIDKDLSTWKV